VLDSPAHRLPGADHVLVQIADLLPPRVIGEIPVLRRISSATRVGFRGAAGEAPLAIGA
jgi:hypothetical protein